MSSRATAYTVELYGLPALLVGNRRVELAVCVSTLGELARALARHCPELCGPVLDPAQGWLQRGYAFVVDGRFTRDPTRTVHPHNEILLVAAQAGG
ncbi:MAG: hypothetical protein NZL87_00860 [Thermomicrobium sp.]|nr:hypothetical protein [Thermomicrobium sp.]